MIRQNQKFMNYILITIDALVIALSMALAKYIRFETNLLGFGTHVGGLGFYLAPLIYTIPSYLLLYYIFGLYDPQRRAKISSESYKLIKVNFIGIFIVTTVLFLTDTGDFSRFMLFFFAVFNTIFSIIERATLRFILRNMRSKGYNLKHVLLIGAGDLAEKIVKQLEKQEYIGYNIIGYLDDNVDKGDQILGHEILGTTYELENIILNNHIDQIIIAISPRHMALLDRVINTCEKHGVKAEFVPDYYRYFQSKPSIDQIGDMPLINIRYVPLDDSMKKAIKRILDVICAIGGLIVLSPLMIVTAIIIKVTSPGPIIFKQERVGLNRKRFQMYKFRSMKVQTEDDEKQGWTTEDDPRKTKFGSFIRHTSIDELPQLFNIIKGDMSLIGPRPERPQFVDKFREEIPKYMIKHHVRPGMTGWAQVHGWRGDTSIVRRIEYDLYYVENWTIELDLKIFILTFLRGFNDKNAY